MRAPCARALNSALKFEATSRKVYWHDAVSATRDHASSPRGGALARAKDSVTLTVNRQITMQKPSYSFRRYSRVILSELGTMGELPTQFPIFKPGQNPTRKGVFLFDAKAAQAVMAEYKRGGVQLALDLEHDSLDPVRRAARNDAGDAMGWYDLQLKSDGSLWAVNVKWTTEGARRLRNKSQRYTSPAFLTSDDPDGERPVRLVNVALCAMPASLENQPLIAASDTSVVGMRADAATVAAVHALAKARGVTKSRLLIDAVTMLAASGSTAPSRDQVSALNALVAALGLPKDVDQETLVTAIKELFIAALPAAEAVPDPTDPSDVGETPDPAPAQLSAAVERRTAMRAARAVKNPVRIR